MLLNTLNSSYSRRLRKYIGPQNYTSWTDKTAKDKMQKDIQVIKDKAEQIFEKFKSYFAFQVKPLNRFNLNF